MKKGRPVGSLDKSPRFKIKDVKHTLENEKFNPTKESLKLFKETKNEWLKFAILKELNKYCFTEPTIETSDNNIEDKLIIEYWNEN